MENADNEPWSLVLTPHKKVLEVRLREIFRYRDLLFLLVRRDFVAQYKQSILGPIWFFLQPLLNTIVFTIVFGKIAKIPTDGIPDVLFFMAGTVVWTYFASVFTDVGQTFATNSGLFGKVYFPRLIVPIALLFNKTITFSIQFALFLVFFFYFLFSGSALHPGWGILLLPVILAHVGVLGMGTGLVVSSLTVKYRDLRFLVTFGLQLWMYATPIVYPASMIPHQWQWVYWINPMAPVVELFRSIFFGAGQVDFLLYAISMVESVILVLIGLMLFTRAEKDFIDRI
jgi:lipopolysaccharide transport system permease protein